MIDLTDPEFRDLAWDLCAEYGWILPEAISLPRWTCRGRYLLNCANSGGSHSNILTFFSNNRTLRNKVYDGFLIPYLRIMTVSPHREPWGWDRTWIRHAG